MGVAVQGNHDVGADLVGDGGTFGLVERGVAGAGRSGHQHRRAEGREPPLHPGGDVCSDVLLAQALGGVAAPNMIGAGVDEHDLVRHARAQHVECLLLAQQRGGPAADRAGEASERTEGVRSGHAVGRQPAVELELAHRVVGVPAEDAVRASRREAQPGQALLECQHVVADHEVPGVELQHPVTQAPARLLQAPVRLRPHDAVDRDPPLLLELPDGHVQGAVEHVPLTVGEQPEAVQPGSDLSDIRP